MQGRASKKQMKKSGEHSFSHYKYFELGDFLPHVNELIKIVIKGHVDLTKFPYEIETIEMKNYKLI